MSAKLKLYNAGYFVKVIRLHAPDYVLKYLYSKSTRVFLFLINGLWALPLVMLSRVIKPVFFIKFGICSTERIGYFIPASLKEIIHIKKYARSTITFWGTRKVSNYQWLKMVKKELLISTKYNYLFTWNKLVPGAKKHTNTMCIKGYRDDEGIFFNDLIKLEMSPKDLLKGSNWLESIGWQGEPFICLLSRDNAYLSQSDIYVGSKIEKEKFFSYHSYRNSDIETYTLAVEYLLEKGYWVFRMGSITEKELKIDHKNFYDYSFSSEKCDLFDIYLFSNCAGCISTGTGIDVLSCAYGIPSLVVNGLPLKAVSTFYNMIWIPKNLFWIENNKSLTLKQYIENSFFGTTNEYSEAGIKIKDLTPQEILNATIEFVDRLENSEAYDLRDQELQKIFIGLLKTSANYDRYHGFIHPKFKIGKSWLSSMADRLL